MNKIIHKNTLALLAVMVMLMATLLTACGSDKTTDISATEDTTNVDTTKEAESAETTEAEEVTEVELAVEEPMAEPTPEPVVYEGIDMESTLPGLEWIQTFDGIIDEPKMVIFNDETNKKVIVENGQEVEFMDTDTLAIFRPLDKECSGSALEDNFTFKKNDTEKNIKFYYDITASLNDGDRVDLRKEFNIDGEDIVLTATLVIKKP